MSKKVLVAYGSWCGSTAEVAQAIAKTLNESGKPAEALSADAVKDLAPYGAVVLGSALRAGRCKAEVTRFAGRFEKQLQQMPHALFAVGIGMMEDTPENREKTALTLKPLERAGQPVSVGLFGGAVDKQRPATFPFNLAIKFMPQGDWRNWPAIEAWARELAGKL